MKLSLITLSLLSAFASATKMPEMVDISLYTLLGGFCPGVTEITEWQMQSGDEFFQFLMDEFDMEEPEGAWIEPLDEEEAIEAEAEMFNLRGNNGNHHGKKRGNQRNLQIDVCKRCKDASNWRRCIRNKCSSSNRRLSDVDEMADRLLQLSDVDEEKLKQVKKERHLNMERVEAKLNLLASAWKSECPLSVSVTALVE